ncbi:hypothetical protein ACWCXH_24095 [Kitasatospora sp. NPDC001660]
MSSRYVLSHRPGGELPPPLGVAGLVREVEQAAEDQELTGSA